MVFALHSPLLDIIAIFAASMLQMTIICCYYFSGEYDALPARRATFHQTTTLPVRFRHCRALLSQRQAGERRDAAAACEHDLPSRYTPTYLDRRAANAQCYGRIGLARSRDVVGDRMMGNEAI